MQMNFGKFNFELCKVRRAFADLSLFGNDDQRLFSVDRTMVMICLYVNAILSILPPEHF